MGLNKSCILICNDQFIVYCIVVSYFIRPLTVDKKGTHIFNELFQ